jgi:hypothetical protein
MVQPTPSLPVTKSRSPPGLQKRGSNQHAVIHPRLSVTQEYLDPRNLSAPVSSRYSLRNPRKT